MSSVAAGVVLASTKAAFALSEDEARSHVAMTMEELKAMLRSPSSAQRAGDLLSIMKSRANLPLIAKFSAGRAWREMTEDQQSRFVTAFSHYVSVTYARRFDDYSGEPEVTVGKTIDAGKKGIIVETPIKAPDGKFVAVEWRVSDRGGRVEIIDLVFEGISLATTQREEIAAMLQKRGGDIERLISDLAAAT
jgi:phospholipid transport system substrate-binding protein